MRKSVMALLLALTLLLAACGGQPDGSGGAPDTPAGPLTLTVELPQAQMTLDPAMNTTQGGETVLYHLFENLLRWEDDGNGWAVLAPGQAERWEAETDYAGNTTYTFTLREGLKWSDGQAVTAENFAAAWRRLADPAKDLHHRELLRMVGGYDQVQDTGDTSLLAVSAPDDRTFVVTLDGSCPYFLAQVCAGAYTMPVPPDLEARSGWGASAAGTVTNGPYTAASFDHGQVVLKRSTTYYALSAAGPEELCFTAGQGPEEDYARFLSGELDLITDLPADALEALAAGESWTPEAVTEIGTVLLNTEQPPFDDPDVRQAFLLAVDPLAAAAAVGPAARPAAGIVPYGVGDCIQRSEEAEETGSGESVPAGAGAALPVPYWDFRAHSLDRVTVPAAGDYDENCQRAKALLAGAGYPGGSGFPPVEYIYVDSETDRALAVSLQAMWREQLGVTVSVRGLSQEAYDAMLLPAAPEEDAEAETGETPEDTADETPPRTTGAYMMAGRTFSVGRWDAGSLLSLWHSGGNPCGYASDGFDILLDSAAAAVSAEAWDAYLHDAEAVLLSDAPVIPVFCQGNGYLLGEGLTGLYRAPDGVYFLGNVHRGASS